MFKLPKLFLLFTIIFNANTTRDEYNQRYPHRNERIHHPNNIQIKHQQNIGLTPISNNHYQKLMVDGKGYTGIQNFHALRNGKDYITPNHQVMDHALRNGKSYNFNNYKRSAFQPSVFNPTRNDDNKNFSTNPHVLRNGKNYGIHDYKKPVINSDHHVLRNGKNYGIHDYKKPVINSDHHVLRNGKNYGIHDYKKPVINSDHHVLRNGKNYGVNNEPLSKPITNHYPNSHPLRMKRVDIKNPNILRNGKNYGVNNEPLSKPITNHYPNSYPLRMKRVDIKNPNNPTTKEKKEIKEKINKNSLKNSKIKEEKSGPIQFIKSIVKKIPVPSIFKRNKKDPLKIYNLYLKDIVETKSSFWKQKVEISSTKSTIFSLFFALADTLNDVENPIEDEEIEQIEKFLKKWYAFIQSAFIIHKTDRTILTYSYQLYKEFLEQLKIFTDFVNISNGNNVYSPLFTNLVFFKSTKVREIYVAKLTWNDGINAIGEFINENVDIKVDSVNSKKLSTTLEIFLKPVEKFNYSIIFSLISHTSYYIKKFYFMIENDQTFVNIFLSLLQNYQKMIDNSKYIADGTKVGLSIPGSVIRYHFADTTKTLKTTTELKKYLIENKSKNIHLFNLILRINSLELNLKSLILQKTYVFEYLSNNQQYISRNFKNITNPDYTPLRIRNDSHLHDKKENKDHKNIIVDLKNQIKTNAIHSHFATLILNFIRLYDLYYIQNKKLYSVNFYYLKFLELSVLIFSNSKTSNNELNLIQYKYGKVDIYQLQVFLKLLMAIIKKSFAEKNSSTLVLIKEGEAIDNLIINYPKEGDYVLEFVNLKPKSIDNLDFEDKYININKSDLQIVNELVEKSQKFLDSTSSLSVIHNIRFSFLKIIYITIANKNNQRIGETNILDLHSANQILLFYLKEHRNDKGNEDLYKIIGEIDTIIHNIMNKFSLTEKVDENQETISLKPITKKNDPIVVEGHTLPLNIIQEDADTTNITILNEIVKNDVVDKIDDSDEENWEDVESSEQENVVEKLTKNDDIAKMVNDLIYNPEGLSKIKKSVTYNSFLRILNNYLTTNDDNRNNLLSLVVEIDLFCNAIELKEDDNGFYYLFDKDENRNMIVELNSSVNDLETADFYQDIKNDLLKLPKDIIGIEEKNENKEYYSFKLNKDSSEEEQVIKKDESFENTNSGEEIVLPKNKSDLSYINTTDEENILPAKKSSIEDSNEEQISINKKSSETELVSTFSKSNEPIKKKTVEAILSINTEEDLVDPLVFKKKSNSFHLSDEDQFSLPKSKSNQSIKEENNFNILKEESLSQEEEISPIDLNEIKKTTSEEEIPTIYLNPIKNTDSEEEISPIDLNEVKKTTSEEEISQDYLNPIKKNTNSEQEKINNPTTTYNKKIDDEFTKYNINRTQSSISKSDQEELELNPLIKPVVEKTKTFNLSSDNFDDNKIIDVKNEIVIPKKKKKLIRRIVVLERNSCELCVNDIFLMQFVNKVLLKK